MGRLSIERSNVMTYFYKKNLCIGRLSKYVYDLVTRYRNHFLFSLLVYYKPKIVFQGFSCSPCSVTAFLLKKRF